MKHALSIAVLAVAAVSPILAADLNVLGPKDKSILKGNVMFQVRPVLSELERFLGSPEISIQDEYGREVAKLTAIRDVKTGICSVPFDTTRLPNGQRMKDGLYLATITYRTLEARKPVEVREDLTFAIRNGATVPARFGVAVEKVETAEVVPVSNVDPEDITPESYDVTVTVLDARGKPMPGARVAFRTSGGELSSDVEITDSEGQAMVTVENEEPKDVTVLVTVEKLAPTTQVLKFAK